jgi:hypothetical protein|tara:strand:- start:264 stop:458 length:195 start_codon:yes stop_codon:yes gene_type:complete
MENNAVMTANQSSPKCRCGNHKAIGSEHCGAVCADFWAAQERQAASTQRIIAEYWAKKLAQAVA